MAISVSHPPVRMKVCVKTELIHMYASANQTSAAGTVKSVSLSFYKHAHFNNRVTVKVIKRK